MNNILKFNDFIKEGFINYLPSTNTDSIIELDKLPIFLKNVEICKNDNYEKSPYFKEFKKFLSNNKDNVVRLYHGTSSKFNILETGLKRTKLKSKRSLQSEQGYVYLSVYPESAKTFGQFAYPNDDIIVYSVDILIGDLKPDHDQLRNVRLWNKNSEYGDSLIESLVLGNGARVKGDIPPYMIKEYKYTLN